MTKKGVTEKGVTEKGVRRLVPRALRARGWAALRTAPVLGEATRRVERVVRRHRPVEGLGVPAGRDAAAPAEGVAVPVVVLLGLGLTGDDVSAWARVVATAQAEETLLRPVWLVDVPTFAELLRHGWAADHVMPRSGYEATGAALPYDEHVARRLAVWRSRTGAAPVLTLLGAPDEGAAGVDRFRAAVRTLSAPGPAARAGRRRSRS